MQHVVTSDQHIAGLYRSHKAFPTENSTSEEAWLLSLKWVLNFSSILLLILFIAVVATREQFHEQFHGIRVNTALAALGGLLSIFSTDFNYTETEMCPVLSALVQFFFTALGSWLVMDSHALFAAVVSGVVGGRLQSYFCIGWGIPFIVVGAVLSSFPYSYGEDERCLMGPTKEMKLSLIGPVLALGGMALVVSFLVVCNLETAVIRREIIVKELCMSTKSCLAVSMFFVTTWVLAIYAFVDSGAFYGSVFYALFVITNSSFGVFYVVIMGICSSPFRRAIYYANDHGIKGNQVDPSACDLKLDYLKKEHYT